VIILLGEKNSGGGGLDDPAVATDFDPAQHGNPPEFPNENKLKRNPPIFTFSRLQFGLRGYKLSFSEPSAVDQFFIF
jgi:hypothetical protein